MDEFPLDEDGLVTVDFKDIDLYIKSLQPKKKENSNDDTRKDRSRM